MPNRILSRSPAGDSNSGVLFTVCLRCRRICRSVCSLRLCLIRSLDVALVLLIAACKQVRAVRHSNVIVVIVVLRMACCVQRSMTRVADRSGRQTLVVVKVVLGIRLEILVTQLAAGASQTIQNGRVTCRYGNSEELFRRL